MESNKEREVLLSVNHLCQYFNIKGRELKAVDDVSFDIYKGEVFGLVGESGCGKTTTGRSIIKLYDITGGDVYFKGQRIAAGIRSYTDAIKAAKKHAKAEIARLNAEAKETGSDKTAEISAVKEELSKLVAEQKANIASAKNDHKNCDKEFASSHIKDLDAKLAKDLEAANGDEAKIKEITKEYKKQKRILNNTKLVTQIQMIFQDPIASLNPRMTVEEIISEGLIVRGITDKEYIREKVYQILETVGLVREHATRYPHEFSGGQRQRIGIARAVIMQPEMIIADEPIAALDVSIQAQVINLLNELRDTLGLTILFVAHDLSVVKYFSDRIGVMYFGKMVELATADELFAHPMHPYTKSLLSAIPLPDPHYEKKRQRVSYNPLSDHDYETNKPSMREITKGHFVYCNDEEEAKYKKELEASE